MAFLVLANMFLRQEVMVSAIGKGWSAHVSYKFVNIGCICSRSEIVLCPFMWFDVGTGSGSKLEFQTAQHKHFITLGGIALMWPSYMFCVLCWFVKRCRLLGRRGAALYKCLLLLLLLSWLTWHKEPIIDLHLETCVCYKSTACIVEHPNKLWQRMTDGLGYTTRLPGRCLQVGVWFSKW